MTSQENRDSLLEQLKMHREVLRKLLVQRAKLSIFTPPYIDIEIQQRREDIQQSKDKLHSLGEIVDDQPDDTDSDHSEQSPIGTNSQPNWPTGRQAPEMRDILQGFRRGRVVLILGHDLSVEAGLPALVELRNRLAVRLADPIPANTGFFETAQLVAASQGRKVIIEELQRSLDTSMIRTRQDATAYDLVAALVDAALIQICVTLTWDDLLVSTFQRKLNERPHFIRPGEPLAYIKNFKSAILNLLGDITHDVIHTIVTIKDVENFTNKLDGQSEQTSILHTIFDDRIAVFLGCYPHDPIVRALLSHKIIDKDNWKPFAICAQMADHDQWRDLGCRPIMSEARALLEQIFWQTRQFINRSYEINIIFHPDTRPVVHLIGCAGLGKTDLLLEVCRRYTHKPGDWRQAFIDLRPPQDGPYYTDTLDIALDIWIKADQQHNITIATERTHVLEGIQGSADRVEAATAIVLNRLVRSANARNLLVVFDSFEMAKVPDLTRWLVSTFVPTLRAGGVLHSRVRILIASRYVIAWNNFAFTNQLTLIPLSPFDAKSISEMLQIWATLKVQQLPGQRAERIVEHVEQLTQGHPAAIKNVLTELAEHSFDPDLGSARPQHFFYRDPLSLFQKHVGPIIERIFERDVPPDEALRRVLRTIAVARRFNPSFLPQLCADELRDKAFQHLIQPSNLVAELQRHHLVIDDRNDQALCYKLDDLVRRLLVCELALRQPDRFAELCKHAFTMYDTTLRELLSDELPDRTVSEEMINSLMNESLFQALQLAEQRKRIGQLVARELASNLQDLLEGYIAIFERCRRIAPQERARRFLQRIEHDEELQQIRRTMLDDNQFAQVLLPIQRFVTAL
jgi:hypothetical protein